MATVMSRAERQQRTRRELVDAAERLFTRNGFHATSLDAVAAEAGFTKGAVYSNFESKEDLFFAVYERRVDIRVEQMETAIRAASSPREALEGIVPGGRRRGEAEDGWLAVFFEFWAHVLRHPELRERFARQHRRVIEPLMAVAPVDRNPQEAYRLATARFALALGLQLERLTQPDVVDADLSRRMALLLLEGDLDGLSD